MKRPVARQWDKSVCVCMYMYNILFRKPEGKRPHGRNWNIWETILK